MKVLLIDDDEPFGNFVATVLSDKGHKIDIATTGYQGLDELQFSTYDLVLLDLQLPDLNGVEVCRELRARRDTTPIILLTASQAQSTKVSALDSGADDYVVKPFDAEELMARARALIRRRSGIAQPVLQWGNLRLDPTKGRVSCGETLLALTAKEYEMLELFLHNPQRIFNAQALLERLWRIEDAPSESAVRTHLKGLRRKLKAVEHEQMIETIRGLGYRLREAPNLERDDDSLLTPEHLFEPETASQPSSDVTAAWLIAQPAYLERISNANQSLLMLCNSESTAEQKRQALLSLHREAHTLKGGLGSFEFPRVTSLVEQLWQQVDEKQHHELDIQDIQTILEQLRQEILATGAASSSTSSAPSSQSIQRKSKNLDSQYQPVLHWFITSDSKLYHRFLKDDLIASSNAKLEACQFSPPIQQLEQYSPQVIWLDLQDWKQFYQLGWLIMAQRAPHVSILGLAPNGSLEYRLQSTDLGCERFALSAAPVQSLWQMAAELVTHKQNIRLMAVDDDVVFLTRLEREFARHSIHLTCLAEPEDFWEVLEKTKPNVLILDIEMYGTSGIDLCRAVRNDVTWRQLPILFVSGHCDSQTLQELFEAQATDYVSKESRSQTLIQRALRCLEFKV